MTLIKDGDKIRKCPNNVVKMGYWKSLLEFYSYKKVLRNFMLTELIESFQLIFTFIIWIILFPLLPFIHCYFDLKRYKKEVKQEQKRKNK